MADGKYISFMVVPDEGGETRSFRIRKVLLKTILWSLGIVVLLMTAAGFFYSHLVREAVEAKRLRIENNALIEQHTEFLAIKRELNKNRELVSRIARLAGVDSAGIPDSLLSDDKDILIDDTFVPMGYPLRGYISKRFSESGLFGEKHLGLDITCPEGTMVLATADGTIEFAGWDDYFGYVVKIEHQYGYRTIFAHNKELRVAEGDRVKRAQVIALSGNSGRSSGPHLHYEVQKNGKSLDPEGFL